MRAYSAWPEILIPPIEGLFPLISRETELYNIVDKVLIGVTAPEFLGLEVDPSTGRFREAPLLL